MGSDFNIDIERSNFQKIISQEYKYIIQKVVNDEPIKDVAVCKELNDAEKIFDNLVSNWITEHIRNKDFAHKNGKELNDSVIFTLYDFEKSCIIKGFNSKYDL